MSGRGPPLPPGLLERFRAAEAQISWRDAPGGGRPGAKPKRPKGARPPPGPPRSAARIAHLNDEEARVEERHEDEAVTIRADSGPVGALVIVLELERRGRPAYLGIVDPDPTSAFPGGAIEVRWDPLTSGSEFSLPVDDLVRLARYALA
ncbi:MAG TPA: hypothetical protein VLY85_00245 [Thermoplasmata archaeon]|nr:hypothetical protein [Thermoplasmata archaeon]